jgi:formylglycine-generating enzyme required for sulfatase activity
MKTQSSIHVRFLSILFWAVLAMGPRAPAQTPTGLDLELYAGLSITGTVGTVYSLEYVTDLARTNAWHNLSFLQLQTTNCLWFDSTAPAKGKRFYRAIQFAAHTNLVFIPPGTFRMGSPTNEVDRFDWEGPQTAVTISQGFWMGKYEVTQGEYLSLMNTNPSYFSTNTGYPQDLSRPVETVSWNDATNYCGKLTQRERAEGRIPTDCVYRLPTEAEWEYACRAWTSTPFSYGYDPGYTNLTNYGWDLDNSGSMTHPVGQKLPNPWGLYDMYGNVFEWCEAWYTLLPNWDLSPYPGGIALDPSGPAGTVSSRGGDWASRAAWCRSAFRNDGRWPNYSGCCFGFRVVLSPGRP